MAVRREASSARPLRPLRILLIAVVPVTALLVGYLAFFFTEGTLSERALEECAQDPNVPTSSITVRWEWWRPGYVCVYLDDAGRVVEERRP
jgi:hypothetical protein